MKHLNKNQSNGKLFHRIFQLNQGELEKFSLRFFFVLVDEEWTAKSSWTPSKKDCEDVCKKVFPSRGQSIEIKIPIVEAKTFPVAVEEAGNK